LYPYADVAHSQESGPVRPTEARYSSIDRKLGSASRTKVSASIVTSSFIRAPQIDDIPSTWSREKYKYNCPSLSTKGEASIAGKGRTIA
jgi:hypothetical protein